MEIHHAKTLKNEKVQVKKAVLTDSLKNPSEKRTIQSDERRHPPLTNYLAFLDWFK